MAGLGAFDDDEEEDEEVSEEERVLMAEAERLKEDLDDLRKSMQDTDFFTLTETIPELPRSKMKPRKRFRGHLAKMTSLQWALDSQHLLTAAQDGKLILWDTYTSNKVQMLTLKVAWVTACALSPSQNLISSGGLDNLVTIYNLSYKTGSEKPFRELSGHDGYVAGIKFIDENQIITCGGDRTCALWDIERALIKSRFYGHKNDINALALMQSEPGSPNVNTFVSVSSDKTCRLWDVRDVCCNQILVGHSLDINGVDYFPNNEYAFVTSSDDGSCRLWDIRGDQPIAIYNDEYNQCGCTSVALSKSGRLLFAGYDDYNCHIWDLLREERIGIMTAHDGRVSAVAVSDDGVAVATGSWDSECIVWTAN